MEKFFSSGVLETLSPHFFIQREVRGTHFSNKRLRIDAVLKPKDISLWKNPDTCFGVEFKLEEKLYGTKEKTAWISQCIDYANTKWDDFGYMYIFSCPSIFDKLRYTVGDEGWLWNRILSQQGVGRLDKVPNYGWTFFLQDQDRIWSESDGVVCGKRNNMKRKFGRSKLKF